MHIFLHAVGDRKTTQCKKHLQPPEIFSARESVSFEHSPCALASDPVAQDAIESLG
jgi:hypothetical protein